MPGLSQLKQFTKDMIALGNESSLRATRGERPVRVPIPKTIKDINDSDDFIVGMPENEIEVEAAPVDNDLSDIINPNSLTSSEQPADNASGGLDLSSLLTPMGDISSEDNGGEPDLSAFLDEPEPEPEPEEVVEEPEPQPVSIADMSLEALLSGTGFDGSDISEIEDTQVQSSINSDEYYTDEELEEIEAPKKVSKTEKIHTFDIDHLEDLGKKSEPAPSSMGNIDPSILGDLANIPGLDLGGFGVNAEQPSTKTDDIDLDLLNLEEETQTESDAIDLDDLGIDVADETSQDDFSSFEIPQETAQIENVERSDNFNLDNLDSFDSLENAGIDNSTGSTSGFDFGTINLDDFADSDISVVTEPLNDFDYPDENKVYEKPAIESIDSETDDILNNIEDISENKPSAGEFDDLNLDDIPEMDIGTSDAVDSLDSLDDLGEIADISELGDDLQLEDIGGEPEDKTSDVDDFGLEDISLDDIGNESSETDASTSGEDFGEISLDDIGLDGFDVSDSENSTDDSLESMEPVDLDDIGLEDLETDSVDSNDSNIEDIGLEDIGIDDFGGDNSSEGGNLSLDDIGLDDTGLEDIGIDDLEEVSPDSEASGDNLSLDSFGLDDFGSSDFESSGSEMPDFEASIPDAEESIPSDGDPFNDFDASELDGLDFTTSSDSENSDNSEGGFDLGNADDFALEGSDFEIEGFTDVDIAKEERKAPRLPSPDFSGALEGTKLPPNTLSDEQYRQFLDNLKEYPLNVRLAFEDLIVKDEFTDDAEFELIEKVLNKVPARQLASTLEKMLDISLPVPRDYEHRTAAEYEAYKKSLEYQLRNKIIPGALVGIVLMLIGIGIFNFAKYCIYKPVKANSLYKQGYTLLQENEYPQSEMKFNEAVTYKVNKKWFFNYARGYREHKQYQRAENIYDRILKSFKHDKAAGLEYANMELYDLANYPRAEEIIRREILDYHVNDSDGMLLLGDNFLEWGTEKDPEKLEFARQQYATLISLYGSRDVYLSRMMRYFVRTDNLQQVLTLKKTFENNKKFKYASDDITEVSGYLLDKLYGPVSPAEEFLRNQIEGLRGMLLSAVKLNPDNPTAWYNLSRYYIDTREIASIENSLQRTILEYNNADALKAKDIYNYIDSYRLLGEYYVDKDDYLKAQEQYTEGLSLYTTERDNAGFAGNKKIGQLYSDLADINYFVSKEYKQALANYEHAVKLNFDNPKIRYRIGYIQYRNRKYEEALGSFMMASEGNARHKNLLLAMANTLSLRGDDNAASGYYETLIAMLDDEIGDEGIVFPQSSAKHNELVSKYLNAANNYGVTLHRLAVRTGNSSLNAEAIVQFQQSVRAWDALTRNQETLLKLEGSNLALENIRYVTHPFPDYEPAIYTDIDKVLSENEGIK